MVLCLLLTFWPGCSHQEISFPSPSVPLSQRSIPGKVFIGMSARPAHRDRAVPRDGQQNGGRGMRKLTKLFTGGTTVLAAAVLVAATVTTGASAAPNDPPKGITPQAFDLVGV